MSSKTVVSTSANPLMSVSETALNDNIITSVIFNKDIPSQILKSTFSGMGTRMQRVKEYAETTYPLGLPQGKTLSNVPVDGAVLEPIIKAEIGYANNLFVQSSVYMPYSPVIPIYDSHLLNVRGYNPATNTIANRPAGLVFTPLTNGNDIDDYSQEVRLESVELSPGGLNAVIKYDLWAYLPVVVKTLITDGDAEGYYTGHIEEQWVLDAASPFEETVAIPGAPIADWDKEVLFAVYQKFDAGGSLLAPFYGWTYFIEDGTYPQLDPTITQAADVFLPVVPLRYRNVDYTDETIHNTPPDPANLYSTSKVLLKKLKLDFNALGDQLNENPGIADIDNAYIMWGVDLQTTDQVDLSYLTEFFDNVAQQEAGNELAFIASLADPDVVTEPYNEYQTDNLGEFSEQGLRLRLQYDYITTNTAPEILGAGEVGYCEKSIDPFVAEIHSWIDEDGNLTELILNETRYKLTLKKQVTAATVKTVVVTNAKLINTIYQERNQTITLRDVFDSVDEHNFVIPLQYNLAETFETNEKNRLYGNSTILIINSYEEIQLAWYQAGWFRAAIMLVAVVIIAYSGQVWIAGLIKAMSVAGIAASIVAGLVYIGVSIAFSVAVDLAFDWLVDKLGSTFGIVGTVILAVAALVLTQGKAGGTAIAKLGMTTSQLLLQCSTALISSTNEFLTGLAQQIQDEYTNEAERIAEEYEQLGEIEDMLGPREERYDPINLVRRDRLYSVTETPHSFFTRTLGLVDNTMYTVHGEIKSFVDRQLTLPTMEMV